MNLMNRHHFNLVEILLALGVIMIGVVSLSGLLPIASKVSSDANMETYVANALEEISAYIRGEATKDKDSWKTWMNPDNEDDAVIPNIASPAMLEDDEDGHVEKLSDWTNWETVGENPLLFKYKHTSGIYQLLSIHGEMSLKADGSLDIDKLDDEFFIDSRIIITVWRSQIERRFINSLPAEKYDYKYGARINIKAGWPAERPEATHTGSGSDEIWTPLRQIKVQAFDLINPYYSRRPESTPSSTP